MSFGGDPPPPYGSREDRDRRPFLYANPIERLFFLWATPLFAKGNVTVSAAGLLLRPHCIF